MTTKPEQTYKLEASYDGDIAIVDESGHVLSTFVDRIVVYPAQVHIVNYSGQTILVLER